MASGSGSSALAEIWGVFCGNAGFPISSRKVDGRYKVKDPPLLMGDDDNDDGAKAAKTDLQGSPLYVSGR